MIAIALFFIKKNELNRVRTPLLFLGALLSLMLLQIVPLPPQIWHNLPGREIAVQGSALTGLMDIWRPLSFEPHATLNSLLATLPGFGVILLLAMMRSYDLYKVVILLVLLMLLSGALGLIQASSGQLYFYGAANRGGAVGFFANRNHQAAMLTCLIPMLALLVPYFSDRIPIGLRVAIASVLSLFIIPLVLVTGSRTGILLLVVGCAGGLLLVRKSGINMRAAFGPPSSWLRRLMRAAPLALSIGLAALVVTLMVSGRAIAINRLFDQDVEADDRLQLFTTMIDMARAHFPFGTGFGTFPTMFKIVEPDWYVRAPYFNHAHNDLLEIIIEGGILSLALMLAFIAWWSIISLRLWRSDSSSDRKIALGRLGSIITLIFTLASVVDYPLRTPIGQVLFLFAMVLMARATEKSPDMRLLESDRE